MVKTLSGSYKSDKDLDRGVLAPVGLSNSNVDRQINQPNFESNPQLVKAPVDKLVNEGLAKSQNKNLDQSGGFKRMSDQADLIALKKLEKTVS